ncbi:MAG: glycoside hydrolase family 71/99 protein [Pirellulaceae bacterium]
MPHHTIGSTANKWAVPQHTTPHYRQDVYSMIAHNALLALLIAHCLAAAPGETPVARPLPGVPWPATDAIGRTLPMADEVGLPRADRWVGIFYFLWHDNPGGKSPHWDGPYDIDRILAADPQALTKPASPYWGPIGMYHYWGEPLYGYYRSQDPWVLKRHAQLLADAGIDTLIFDTTNAATYTPVYMKLCEVFTQVRHEGGRTPQICFMVNTKAGQTARRIYEDLYKRELYRDLWFVWEGKPLMICDPQEADAELQNFFTLRRAHWPFTMVNTQNAWHWEATYPQPYGYTHDPEEAEMVNVSVAQNLRVADGRVTNMSNGDARGRSFHRGQMESAPHSVNLGLNFQEQWQRVEELKPPFVMITGWNEWIAGRWGDLQGPLVFVDQFDQQYSRDIEPAVCGHHDNYYWQMIANVRRYKGAPALPTASAPMTIEPSGTFDQWQTVVPEYETHAGDTDPRDFAGAGGTHYKNFTGRNDIVACKVARDTNYVYFYVRTREPLTSPPEGNWMWLLIRSGDSPTESWEGFDYMVNRRIEPDGTTWLERSEGGWKWEPVVRVQMRWAGPEMHIAIPRDALGLAAETTRTTLDFKWIDNAQKPGDILDVYVSGDSAPSGRFRYRYTAQ